MWGTSSGYIAFHCVIKVRSARLPLYKISRSSTQRFSLCSFAILETMNDHSQVIGEDIFEEGISESDENVKPPSSSSSHQDNCQQTYSDDFAQDVCCRPCYRGQTSHVCVVSYENEEKVVIAVELSYIGQECHSIPNILGEMYGKKARRLDLSFNALSDLSGLQMFPFLEELVLDNNDLDDSVQFVSLPRLHTLSLNKNNFRDLETLLSDLIDLYPEITYLSLLGNPACPDQLSNCEKDDEDYARYRYYVLHRIPRLKFLDSTPVRDYERSESKRVGSFMIPVKPNDDYNDGMDPEEIIRYSPLPSNGKKEGTHRGAFGKLRQRYTGAHSEGNRFIKDKEL